MKQRQRSVRSWWCALVLLAMASLRGSLAADTKAENEAKPKLLHLFPGAAYAKEDFKYPLYEIIVVGENLPNGDLLRVYLDDREVKIDRVDEETGQPPRKS